MPARKRDAICQPATTGRRVALVLSAVAWPPQKARLVSKGLVSPQMGTGCRDHGAGARPVHAQSPKGFGSRNHRMVDALHVPTVGLQAHSRNRLPRWRSPSSGRCRSAWLDT
jgi:hypothetical protein